MSQTNTVPRSTSVFIQNACLQHRYIRSKDLSNIVERPERLRAVNIGLAAAIARLEELVGLPRAQESNTSGEAAAVAPNDLADIMNNLKIGSSPGPTSPLVGLVNSEATVDILNHTAVKFVHGDIDRDVYLENLVLWAKASRDKIANGQSEIPEDLSQGDLYLCPESINAMQGAIGTVCEAVDRIFGPEEARLHRTFVAIRPPGHHCGEDTPSGFCFLNNVAVAAAHAHLQHKVKRVVIFDIDLHHGNGTQSIVWQINEESYRQTIESEAGAPNVQPGPTIFYGSIHDILSYPCEDGKPSLVQAASVSIHKSHGQYIENVHLETYTSEEHFWDVLYKERYSKVLTKAKEFLDHTGGPGDDVLFFISCGMDACEHEYESMSRHNRKVPTSFYYRFAKDTCALANEYAQGRVISVLEGGYSDRALTSGAMAHLSGLVDLPSGSKAVDESWWNVENLTKLEAATKKRRGGRPSAAQTVPEPWIDRTLAIFSPLDTQATASKPRITTPIPVSNRTLRSKVKGAGADSPSVGPTPVTSPSVPLEKKTQGFKPRTSTSSSDDSSSTDNGLPDKSAEALSSSTKKLPKVILKLGPNPHAT
ncbi:hypothetical protein CVT24_008200 [Panaeolus cyanescens]|uniref:Histone deacetylase domain-containing protein n=1 Tax=Panaeolus cyanescens TaxID=181874 RepID=A0A409VF06_9AGAR|nr:hypothetical protein CVT24_008200 [Panaeolus cyanescens]